MAKLNKEQYYRRAVNAEQRNANNEEIAISNGMPEHWAEIISTLCRVRHEMHCNIDKLVKSSEIDAMEIRQSIVEVNSELRESGYDYIDSLPSSVGDYIEIDSIDYIYEIEDLPSDDDEREKYLSEKYDEIYEQWSTVNNKYRNILTIN